MEWQTHAVFTRVLAGLKGLGDALMGRGETTSSTEAVRPSEPSLSRGLTGLLDERLGAADSTDLAAER